MNTHTQEAADPSPFRIAKRAEDTDGEYVRAEATIRPLRGKDGSDSASSHNRWFEEAGPLTHLHPVQEERIEVLEGEYRVRIKRETHTLKAGEQITVPVNTSHAHWNGSGALARIAVEHHPANHSDKLFEALYRLAQDGQATQGGLPKPISFAIVNAAYPDVVYAPWPPVFIQKLFNRCVAQAARIMGHRSLHALQHAEQPASKADGDKKQSRG